MPSVFRQTVRGMRDLLPDEAEKLRFVEQNARNVANLYGYREVITPILEHYELLAAKAGEEIRKRMYAFEDLGGRRVALRPEFTASIARLVATKMTSISKPIRLFSSGTIYRYDEPQFGRYREFWQANYELFGSSSPEADAEILALTDDLMKKVGIRNHYFKTGHVGILRGILDQEGIVEERQNSIMQLLDKQQWDEALKIAQEAGGSQKCLNSMKTLFSIRGQDPRIVTREISEAAKDYPEALKAVENLREIVDLLEASGDIKFVLDAGFARGLEYYTGLIFEVYVSEMNVALGGGGRYDKLIELFGGEKTPAVGVAHGPDRFLLAMDKQGAALPSSGGEKILVIPIDSTVIGEAFKVSSLLRKEGFRTETEVMRHSVSRALSNADKKGITNVVIIGPKETKERRVVFRDMKKRTQETISLEELRERIRC